MTYRFRCDVCGSERYIPLEMSHYNYEKDRQFCSNCSHKLRRVLEWEGLTGLTGGYDSLAGKASWQRR